MTISDVERALNNLKKHPDISSDTGNFDAVREMEKRLESLTVTKEHTKRSEVKKQVAYFISLVKNINIRLMLEEKLDDVERKCLFRDREMLIMYIKMNSSIEIDKLIESLTKEIFEEHSRFYEENED